MRAPHIHQRGVALLTVMVVLVLGTLTIAASARSGLLHEMIVGNQSDQSNAQAAAEALLRDAERDILGGLPDGKACLQTPSPSSSPEQTAPTGATACRDGDGHAQPAALATPRFPQSNDAFDKARAEVQVGAAVPCREGVCFPSTLQSLAHIEDALEAMQPHGATYGQFTRAGLTAPAASGNPLLTAEPARAWYWVEAFRYDVASDTQVPRRHLQPEPGRPFVYRITAVAHGFKPGTRAVAKRVFVPYPNAQMP